MRRIISSVDFKPVAPDKQKLLEDAFEAAFSDQERDTLEQEIRDYLKMRKERLGLKSEPKVLFVETVHTLNMFPEEGDHEQ